MGKLSVILGNQLFPNKYYKDFPSKVFMCEDMELCSYFKFHKHKIIHFLSSMREYADNLDKDVYYFKLQKKQHFFDKLLTTVEEGDIDELILYEIEDKFFEKKFLDFCQKNSLKLTLKKTPMFLCSRREFHEYLNEVKSPVMRTFYERMRKKENILLEGDRPVGGKWSFDKHNRKKIPKKFDVTSYKPKEFTNETVEDVKKLVDKYFNDHPGDVDNYWIPTNRKAALKWMKSFFKDRFKYFGDYQDALDERNPFLYHSLLSPFINIGFLTPDEVIKVALEQYDGENISGVEGFVRQVLGWREFLRGIYQNYEKEFEEKNFFKHKKKLTKHWYEGTTGIEPVDQAIEKVKTWGYAHHIERLMVLGNIMLLLEVDPKEVYKWFMEMFVDSSDWVMAPNVYGMSQFSDGGIFATKPYISGSNYLLKMGHFKKSGWCDEVDGLYWRFIDRHRDFFSSQHRMSMMVSLFDKMDQEKKDKLFSDAKKIQKRLTT